MSGGMVGEELSLDGLKLLTLNFPAPKKYSFFNVASSKCAEAVVAYYEQDENIQHFK